MFSSLNLLLKINKNVVKSTHKSTVLYVISSKAKYKSIVPLIEETFTKIQPDIHHYPARKEEKTDNIFLLLELTPKFAKALGP